MIIGKFLVATILLFSSVFTFAQSQDDEQISSYSGNQVYAEFMGPGVIFSANFDSRFRSGTGLGLGYRVGLGFGLADQYYYDYYSESGYYSSSSNLKSYVTIPVGINYVFGKKSSPHTFEVGAGVTLLTRKIDLYNYGDTYQPGYVIGHTTFMYRRKPINGGFTWRIGFMPVIGTGGDISPSFAVGIGYAF